MVVAELKLTNTAEVAFLDIEDMERPDVQPWDWRMDPKGYIYRRIGRCGREYLHRVLMNAPSGMEVDHHDHDPRNNYRSNLRLVTVSQNQMNMLKPRTHRGQPTSSKFKGVSWKKGRGKWEVRIQVNGRPIHIGYFDSELDAACAYNQKAAELFGEFARLNDVTELAA